MVGGFRLPKTVRALLLLALLALIPLLVRGASEVRPETHTVAMTQPEEPETTPSMEAETSPTPSLTNVYAPPPTTWDYHTSRLDIEIERFTQGDFVYFVADVQLSDPAQFSYAFSHEKYKAGTESLSDIAARHLPILAFNGDYYDFHSNGIIIRGGELFRKKNSARALLIVEADGDLRVVTDRSEKQGDVADRLMEEGALHTFEFGPVLVDGGQAVPLESKILRVEPGYLEPRTAIGQIGELHYLVIVVDGRQPGYSEGCDMPALQQLFVDRGARVAFNLDGGGSTTLYFNGDIINSPAMGDERKVSDIIMILP